MLAVGGFSWWDHLPPEHAGEEVVVQFLLLNRYGGCGILPSGTYHLGLPTNVPDRRRNATELFDTLLERLDERDRPLQNRSAAQRHHPRSPMPDQIVSVPPRVSVIMPTFKQARFLRRAIDSLLTQSLTDWELIVVDDGSPDDTQAILAPFLDDPRMRGIRFDANQGLGRALNAGLDASSGPLIAYLPSDDVWYRDHLASMVDLFTSQPDLVLAYSGVRHHYNRSTPGQIEGEPLQLVQTMHRRTGDRWLERSELTTDDLERMLWSRLRARGHAAGTGLVTCEWVDHPGQRHKLLREPIGGINPYRLYCNVREPMRFHSTEGNFIDEVERFARFRDRPDTPLAADGLKILLVGELAYNPERVLALEERGHQLFGLWMPNPYWYNYVGPLPFGHVRDLDVATWQDDVRRIQPDVIYALLNWQAVPFARSVLDAESRVFPSSGTSRKDHSSVSSMAAGRS